LNNANEVLEKLNTWLKVEYKHITELDANSHDREEKIRLHAEHGIIKKVLEKLDEYEHN